MSPRQGSFEWDRSEIGKKERDDDRNRDRDRLSGITAVDIDLGEEKEDKEVEVVLGGDAEEAKVNRKVGHSVYMTV